MAVGWKEGIGSVSEHPQLDLAHEWSYIKGPVPWARRAEGSLWRSNCHPPIMNLGPEKCANLHGDSPGTHRGLREPSCVIAWGLDERPWPICLICLSLWPFHRGSNPRLPELPMDTGKMCSVQCSWEQKAGPCLRTPVTFWAYVKCPESRP